MLVTFNFPEALPAVDLPGGEDFLITTADQPVSVRAKRQGSNGALASLQGFQALPVLYIPQLDLSVGTATRQDAPWTKGHRPGPWPLIEA